MFLVTLIDSIISLFGYVLHFVFLFLYFMVLFFVLCILYLKIAEKIKFIHSLSLSLSLSLIDSSREISDFQERPRAPSHLVRGSKFL